MSTRAHYHVRDMTIDLADLPRWLYDEMASLHGQIDPPPAPPVLTCLGNSQPMYVYRHETGRYFAPVTIPAVTPMDIPIPSRQ